MESKQIYYTLEAIMLLNDGYDKETIVSYGISRNYVDIAMDLFMNLKLMEVKS